MKYILLTIFCIVMFSCNTTTKEIITDKFNNTVWEKEYQTSQAHNAQNSLDWEGIYEGTLPCADCDGILTKLQLDENSYSLISIYLGKDNKPFEEKGTLSWNEGGDILILTEEGESVSKNFKVKEGSIVMLNADNKENTGELAEMYILKKK